MVDVLNFSEVIKLLFVCSLFGYLKEWLSYFSQFLKLQLKSSQTLKMENVALRSQLALYSQRLEKENLPKPRPSQAFRQLWVFLSRHLDNWNEVLIIVKPDTVIK